MDLKHLGWLRDAPLFIDEIGVARLYESVVRPNATEGPRTIAVQRGMETSGKASGQVEGKIGLGAIWDLLGLGAAEAKVQAGGEVARKNLKGQHDTITLHPISTPERKLVQITAVYLANYPERLRSPKDPSDLSKLTRGEILDTPRLLVFLDLPGMMEPGGVSLKIIPTAAEFEGGKIHLLYKDIEEALQKPSPPYPDRESDAAVRASKEREYWSFFQTEYSATQAIVAIENASSKHGRLRWIDYRLPLDAQGNTLHLHVSPNGAWDTGVLAYHFVRRGYKHGVRLVGTLKSEPTMDVLAIFGK